MPAIATTANPLASPSSPVARSATSGAQGSEAGDRPFAAVLKEKATTAPDSDKSSTPASTSDSGQTDEGAESSVDGSAAAQWVLNGVQVAQQPPDAVLAEFTSDQSSTVAIERALLAMTAQSRNSLDPANTAIIADDGIGEYDSKSIAGLAASPSIIDGSVAVPDSDSFEQTLSDIRVALSRSASGNVPQSSDASGSPAKYAAPMEIIALETGSRAMQGSTASSSGDLANLLVEAGPASMVLAPAVAATNLAGRSSEFPIAASLGTPHWQSSIGNSLIVMSGQQQDRAELVLNPPQLGRIEVSLSLRGEDASVTFVSSNPLVRDALENALPRLKEILADAGITLGQTQVGSESPGQTAKDGQNRDNSPGSRTADIAVNGTLNQDLVNRESTSHRRMSLTLVDTYA